MGVFTMLREINVKMKKRKGYDLVQLAVWTACIIVLLSVLGPKYLEYQEKNRRTATAQEVKVLAEQCALYTADSLSGLPPTTLGDLVTGLSATQSNDGVVHTNYLSSLKVTSNASTFVDKWKNPYVYDSTARTITSTANGGTPIVEPF
jgi:type II secretory pathway pseudopilin PulG